jgi:hypothetical protein
VVTGGGAPSPPPPPGTAAFASVRGVTLYLPVRSPIAVGYHEASLPDALALRPLGRCAHDYNRTKFVPPRASDGPEYLVMSSRGRPHPATSAADVALLPDVAVLAPVTGTVKSVKTYRLYGAYPDLRLAITPDGHPRFRVVLIHVRALLVRPGDVVFAGVTRIARVRVFPFSSQVNDYIGPGIPHVHIEVKEIGP